jgi:hypothetical protein
MVAADHTELSGVYFFSAISKEKSFFNLAHLKEKNFQKKARFYASQSGERELS